MSADCMLLFLGGKLEALIGDDDEFICGTNDIEIIVETYGHVETRSEAQVEDIQLQIRAIEQLIARLNKAKKELENGTPLNR